MRLAIRYIMLLCLIVWLGGILFFGAVLAPTVFAVLPTTHLAGNVVSRALGELHWIGIVCGLVLLLSLMFEQLIPPHVPERPGVALPVVLVCLMLALTAVSQFAITPRMAALRRETGEIDAVPRTDPRRASFDRMHVWSTRLEGGVLVAGLVLVGTMVARREVE